MNKKIFLLLSIFCISSITQSRTEVFFGSQASRFVIRNDGELHIDGPCMFVSNGTVFKEENGSIKGNPIDFENGIYSNNGATSFFSVGQLTSEIPPPKPAITIDANTTVIDGIPFPAISAEDPEVENTVKLDEKTYLVAGPGNFRSKIFIEKTKTGNICTLNGQPLLFKNNSLEIEETLAGLIISVQNALNTNVIFNGGTMILEDDLSLGDDAQFVGPGQMVFNNRSLSLGGGQSIWDGLMLWNNALDLQLNSLTKLVGTWAFVGDGQINGNGNVLDIADGGRILLLGNSTLRMTAVKIKGLGTGSILMDEGAQLRLSDVEIEMDLERNSDEKNPEYVINTGGIYIDGPTNIITKNNILRFSEKASLTVDRVPLSYDPLETIDNFNIRPLRIQDPNHKHVTIINNGTIRRIRQESISFVDYSSDTAMQRYAIVFPGRPMHIFPESINGVLNFDVRVNGQSHFLGFTRSDEPLLFLEPGVNAVFENILFRDFSPRHLSRGENTTFIFGNKTIVRTARDEYLDDEWVFEGDTILKCGGNILELGPNGKITVQGQNSTLLIEGVILKGLSGNKIECTDNSNKLIMKGVTWIQDGPFFFNAGGIDVFTDFIMRGGQPFTYASTQPFTILQDATMQVLRNVIFNYAPADGNRNLFQMVDGSSTLRIENMTLSAPTPGLQLTNGRLVVSQQNFLLNNGAASEAEGITFGDGNVANNLILEKPTSATLEVLSGFQENLNA